MRLLLISNSGFPLYGWCKKDIAEFAGDNKEITFPVILIKERGFLTELISTQEINQQKNLDELMILVHKYELKLEYLNP